MTYQGRRREDTAIGHMPPDVQPGDYWRVINAVSGRPVKVEEQGNLTSEMWMVSAPNGAGLGTLTKHTVRAEDDGTASIRPNDGSSNSVLITGGVDGARFHGYLEHGVWNDV